MVTSFRLAIFGVLVVLAALGGVAPSAATAEEKPLGQAKPAPDPSGPKSGKTAEWKMFGGNPARNAQGLGGVPFLEASWKMSLANTDQTKNWLKEVDNSATQRGQPLLPAALPLTVMLDIQGKKLSLVVFRSRWGIHGMDLKTGKMRWETPSDWSLERMLHNTKTVEAINRWVGAALRTRPTALVENSTIGTLSSDGKYVFAVDDFALPPPKDLEKNELDDRKIATQLIASHLHAYDLATGKLRWEIGGRDKEEPLHDCLFLGPPLPLNGKLYAVVETNHPKAPAALFLLSPYLKEKSLLLGKDAREQRLVTLDPTTGKLLAARSLLVHGDESWRDGYRRIHALHLAYSDGVLVCPTNVGVLIGVDLAKNRIVWRHTYPLNRGENSVKDLDWQTTAPIIAGGKVVFTAPDGKGVTCLGLHNGVQQWYVPGRKTDRYLAGVIADKVLLVGQGDIRALSLAKGALLWHIATGLPSGRGISSGNIYYLPLKKAVQSKEPEVCAIDVVKGKVIAHTRSRKQEEVPGNLLFFDDAMLSQTATTLTAYPQLLAHLKKINKLLDKNPNDPVGLYSRGQLRFDKGDLSGAIADLRAALQNKPDGALRERIRALLFETLTELLQRDFGQGKKYLKEYEELCKSDDKKEQRQRRLTFLMLAGRGHESQGELLDALRIYFDLAALDGDELVTVTNDPALRARRYIWARGRIAVLLKSAKPEQRKQLDEAIKNRWKALKSEDISSVRRFVALIGPETEGGREARFDLAARYIKAGKWLDAELVAEELRKVKEETVQAKAIYLLAEISTRRGRLDDAVYFYRLLQRDHAKTKIHDGKTGAQLFDELKNDKRYLPYLEMPGKVGATGKNIKVEETHGQSRLGVAETSLHSTLARKACGTESAPASLTVRATLVTYAQDAPSPSDENSRHG